MKKQLFFTVLSLIVLLVTSCSQDFEDGVGGNSNTNLSQAKDYVFAYKAPKSESDLMTRATMSKLDWPQKYTITIGFLNGSDLAQQKVKEVSKQWEDLINLKFQYTTNLNDAEVRIGFTYNGDRVSWSYIGVDCVEEDDPTKPTMNLLLYEDNNPLEINSEDFSGIILREFGHMLGLVNEHQSPKSPITIDEAKAISYFRMFGWTDEQVKDWIAYKYKVLKITDTTEYDENSIMAMYIPAHITTNGIGSNKFNTTLSEIDKEFINKMYPRPLTLAYEVGAKGSVYMVLYRDTCTPGWNFDTETSSDYIEKTYKTVDIGEYTWTAENLKMKYGSYWSVHLESFNFTQDKVNQITGTTGAYTVKQFEDIFGTWVTEYLGYATTYRNSFKFYTSNGGAEITGFDLPDVDDILQLIGQAPAKSDDVRADLRNFLHASPADIIELSGNTISAESSILKLPYIANSESISKLNITPLGFRRNAQEGVDSEPYSFGYGFGLRMKDYTGMFEVSDISGIVINKSLYHFCQARYCKRATPAELGYELYYSKANDDVIVLAPTATAPSGYTVLTKGLERGITLRYSNIRPSNTGEKNVTESWSTIQNEAERIRKSLK